LCVFASASAAIFSLMAWSKASECSLILDALRKIYRAVKAKEDCLGKKAVLAVVEAARLLSEDAKEMYEKTGDEKYLEIARRWEEFVKANKNAVEKVLGYPSK